MSYKRAIFLILFAAQVFALPNIVPIGGLFHPMDENQENAFRHAIEAVNANNTTLPRIKLLAKIEKFPPQNSFHASKQVCGLIRSGVAGIFGPQSAAVSTQVQSICDTLELPHLEARWDYRIKHKSCVVNLYPHATSLSRAYAELVEAWGWRSFTIIYESEEGLIRLQELLKTHTRKMTISIRQLPDSSDFRPFLKQMRVSAESRIVLDCATERVHDILKQAQQVGMMSDYHSYIITSLIIDLEDFKYGGTNITGFRLVDASKLEVQQIVQNWNNPRANSSHNVQSTMSFVKTETVLMYDAVHLFAKALHELDTLQKIDLRRLSCDDEDTWPYGYSLINHIKTMEMKGLTGLMKFDKHGVRSEFSLDILELSPEGLNRVGTWDSSKGIRYLQSFGENQKQIVKALQNRTVIVTTILSPPYCMLKQTSRKLSGNAQFEGYVIDLIHNISLILNFSYSIRLVADGNRGAYNQNTGEWNGMVRELIDQKADIAIADLTITYQREQVVDFTVPYMNLGISILYKKPMKQPPNLFSFLSPLSVDVWLYMATAYLGVSIILYVISRFSPYELVNDSSNESQELENQFTLLNSLWFTIASLMQQGTEIAPRAPSTRMIACMWWFLILIMISSYTANLAAFLTIERLESPIQNVEDLAEQNKIKYGAVKDGSTASFFKYSNLSIYQKMWRYMESAKPSVFTATNEEGVERVMKGNYAFLMESPTIEYVIERNCELMQIGEMLDAKGYGIALPPNSPYRKSVSYAVLKLLEEGKLSAIKTKWWEEEHGGGACIDDTSKTASATIELSLANVGGVFIVMTGGICMACIVAVCEILLKPRKSATDVRESIYSNMATELEQVLKFPIKDLAEKKRRRDSSNDSASQYFDSASYKVDVH